MLDVTYMGVFVAGILSFLSPCVLPLVPPYLCYIGGQSIEDMTADGGVSPHMLRRIFLSALLFVFGFSTVFITLGATASVIGEWLADNLGILTQVAGVIIVVLGLAFHRHPAHPAALSRGALRDQRPSGGAGRGLCGGARLRLRLDALRRAGAGGGPDGRRSR